MKVYIYVTNPIEALHGNFDWCLNISTRNDLGTTVDDWSLVGETDIDVNLDFNNLTQMATDALDAKEKELTAKFTREIEVLKEERSKLLSIEYNPVESNEA